MSILQFGTVDEPVITGGASFYGGAVNQPIAPAPTGLTGDSTPSVDYYPIIPPPEVLLYPPPNIAPPAPPGSIPPVQTQPASSPCGGCGKGTSSPSSPPPATGTAVKLAPGVTLGAPAPETAAQAAAPFPWWWLLAAAVVGYAARGKGRR